jgi:membrane protease YdiL (CAAX protease family)
LIVAAPVVEEIVFRGLLLPALRIRWAFWPAAVVSSLVFALAHVSPLLIPTLFILGLGLAWLRELFDSVYPPIVMHALNNGLAVAVLVASAPS